MHIYIDENISPYLAKALDILESREPTKSRFKVTSIQERFTKGVKDIDLIPEMGKEKAIWITKDKRLLRRYAEIKLILQHEIGIIILTPYWSKVKHWELVKVVINNWQEIKLLNKNKKPFAYKINGNGKIIRDERVS